MGGLLGTLARAEDVLSKAFLAGCSALVFVAAITRAFGAPVIWAIDVAMLLFIWCAFFGANKALRNRQHIIIDIVVRYFFADKAKGPNMQAIAAAAPEAEYVLAAIQDLMLGSDPYLVGRVVSFSDLLLAPIVASFVQFQEGTRAMAKLPKLSHWWLAMQQRPSFTATAPKM